MMATIWFLHCNLDEDCDFSDSRIFALVVTNFIRKFCGKTRPQSTNS